MDMVVLGAVCFARVFGGPALRIFGLKLPTLSGHRREPGCVVCLVYVRRHATGDCGRLKRWQHSQPRFCGQLALPNPQSPPR